MVRQSMKVYLFVNHCVGLIDFTGQWKRDQLDGDAGCKMKGVMFGLPSDIVPIRHVLPLSANPAYRPSYRHSPTLTAYH